MPKRLHPDFRPSRAVRLAWVLAVLGLAAACRQDRSAPEPAELAPGELVRVGDAVISEDQFRWERARGGPAESDSALLERLVRRELLYAEAIRLGVPDSDELKAAWKNLVRQHFQERLETQWDAAAQVTDAEVQEEYEAHRERYSIPAQVRVALIQLPASASAERMELIRRQAVDVGSREADFGTLATVSVHPSGRRGRGDLGWLNEGQAVLAFPPDAVAALFALESPGAISPAIATSEGTFLFKLMERRAAQPRPLATVRDGIRTELRRRRVQDLEQAQLAEWRTRHGVRTNAPRLAELAADRSQPSLAVRPPRLPAN